jgi:hypothetical protein
MSCVCTPEIVTERLQRYVDEDASLFILSFLGGNWEKEVTLFAEEVMPMFRK